MAKAKVVHSADACMIIFKGQKSKPEPSTGIIKFPGGHVEVSRTSDGKYWAHVYTDEAANIVDSRIDYDYEGWCNFHNIPKVPGGKHIQKIAVKIDGPYVSSETL